MRVGRLVAIVVVVGVVLAVGAYVWLGQDVRREASASAYAQQAAHSLATGQVPDPIAGDRGAAQARLATTLAGMGSIPHAVTVEAVALDEAKGAGSVTFEHTWTVHAGRPWTYRTTMPLTRHDDEWRGTWSNGVVAPGLADSERLGATRVNATRGRILGADGAALVADRPVYQIGISRPKAATSAEAVQSARRLAALVGIEPDAYAAAVSGAGPQAFVEAIVYRDRSADLATAMAALGDIPGAEAIADSAPLAPTTAFAAPILGRVGQATAEIVEKSGGRVRPGDTVGLSGLQAAQNERLAGRAGYTIEAIPPQGRPRELFGAPPTNGRDVTVSLDLRAQTLAESALAKVSPASAIVAIRPSDGHVLAAASGPGGQGYSTALLGQYAPGSTFKTVTALALLRAGLTPESRLACTATAAVDGRVFKNYDNYPSGRLGRIRLREVFANSCNTGLIAARDRLDPDSLAQAAGALGLTSTPALGVPAELGSVPATTGETDLAAAQIGQARVLASPLGMATVAASIAAGHLVEPVLVTDPPTPRPTGSASPGSTPPRLTAEEAETLRGLMREVVTNGSATFLRGVPGGPVLAKTGTAEYGSDSPPRTHAWMLGIHGDLAVAVFVADGSGGARTAGPILQSFLTGLAEPGR